MKAIVCSSYGSPDVLKCEDIEKPAAGDNEVLIRVRAASLNPLDLHLMKGTYALRLLTGLGKPKDTRIGRDVAGEVEAVGTNVAQFKPGDAVFGTCHGAFAEYACISETRLATKPNNMTFEQAAAVPIAALTALQGLRDKGRIQPGQKVLINGAAGGVGTFTVQIAKSFGAEVTGVCSTKNVDLVRSLGADFVTDYTREDFTKGTQRYDLIFDLVANHSLSACRRVLNPKGIYIGAGVLALRSTIGVLVRLIAATLLSRLVSQSFLTSTGRICHEDLIFLSKLMEAGKVTPVIDRCYRLSEVPEAMRYLGEGHAQGKVVITLE